MSPELDPDVAESIINEASNDGGRFVREGKRVWLEPINGMTHAEIVKSAGFVHPDDAGFFDLARDKQIVFFGFSRSLDLGNDSDKRNTTIKVSQETVKDRANIIRG